MSAKWGLALVPFALAFALLSTLPTQPGDSYALVGGVALSGGRLELLRFLREPHEFPVVAATTSFPEMTLALRALTARQARWDSALHLYDRALRAQPAPVAELPPPQGNAESWLNGLRAQGVTHVALFRDLPETSSRAKRESAVADAIASLPGQFDLVWDGRLVEVYEVAR